MWRGRREKRIRRRIDSTGFVNKFVSVAATSTVVLAEGEEEEEEEEDFSTDVDLFYLCLLALAACVRHFLHIDVPAFSQNCLWVLKQSKNKIMLPGILL